MVSKERLNEFIATAYKTACDHGFHDEEKSNSHWMMLVCTEVAEMVEADRNNRHAIYNAIEYCDKHTDEIDVSSRNRYFERDVKNTLEDETADVCIRLFDFLGEKGIEPETFEDKVDDWKNMFKTCGGNESNYGGMNKAITEAGGTGLLDHKGYWTSTKKGSTDYFSYCLNTVDNCNINFDDVMKSNRRYVRVCLKF